MHIQKYDFVIIGGGILGTTIAYWISSFYEGKIAVLEQEEAVAIHTSSRNTGVIHRPFYLDPVKRQIFAHAAQVSYGFWKAWAYAYDLPWRECGTIEVALDANQIPTLEKYARWAVQNGMEQDEVAVLSAKEVRALEPHVHSHGGIFSKTDTSVDFGAFTRSVAEQAQKHGVEFSFETKVTAITEEKEGVTISCKNEKLVKAHFVVNCAGGTAVDLAHAMGVALEYTDLHFRGDYWVIDPCHKNVAHRNIYSVPRHTNFPFLDPHWVVRPDGSIWIGPTAVPVATPYQYKGVIGNPLQWIAKLCEKPLKNKWRLFRNPEFLQLTAQEWKSALSRRAFVNRMQEFLPAIREGFLQKRGIAGIRSSVIDANGGFVREALTFDTPHSFHVLNYNSPGATGAPGYTAHLVGELKKKGALDFLKKRQKCVARGWENFFFKNIK